MEGFTCPSCGEGEIVMKAEPGRRMRFRQLPGLELPETLALPTCSSCGELWLDAESTRAVEEALGAGYAHELSRRAGRAIEALRGTIPQRELERLIGVSPGLLSKVKQGKDTSATLTALLMLLQAAPHRVDELRQLWAATPTTTPIVELEALRIRQQSGPPRTSRFSPAPAMQLEVRGAPEGSTGLDWQGLAA